MNSNFKKSIKCILFPLLLGILSWFLSSKGITNFQLLNKPALTPPRIVFPIVWTILYITMGISCDLIRRTKVDKATKSEAFLLYYLQLAINFFWPILFFRFQAYFFAFIWLLFLWAVLWMTIQSFYEIRKPAGLILIPYILWVSFAGYLNLTIALMN